MRRLPVTLHGRTFEVTQHDDGTFEMPPELAALQGRNVALKPGQETWWLARKPLAASTVAGNVIQFGTGALNIDGCKVAHASEADLLTSLAKNPGRADTVTSGTYGANRPQQSVDTAGRWPTNVVFTHSATCEPVGMRRVKPSNGSGRASEKGGGFGGGMFGDGTPDNIGGGYVDADGMETVEAWSCDESCPVAELDRQSGVSTSTGGSGDRSGKAGAHVYEGGYSHDQVGQNAGGLGDTGGASRFYPTFKYQAKAPASERPRLADGTAHETVKPLGLVSWLVKLITPPGGTVLDLFAGSGPVGEACIIEGFSCVLIEQDPKSAELIKTRLSKPIQPAMLTVDDSAPAAPARPVAAASRPKPVPEAHPSLFDELDAAS